MYRSYYPHRSRDSLSPLCGIFSIIGASSGRVCICSLRRDLFLKDYINFDKWGFKTLFYNQRENGRETGFSVTGYLPHNNYSNRKLKSTVLYPTFCLLRMFLQEFLKVEDRRQGIYIWPTTVGAFVGLARPFLSLNCDD